MGVGMASGPRPSIADVIAAAPWTTLEGHLDGLRERIDASIESAHRLRASYRDELLARSPELQELIARPSTAALSQAESLLSTGTVAASDGTVVGVPLLGGAKIQVGVV